MTGNFENIENIIFFSVLGGLLIVIFYVLYFGIVTILAGDEKDRKVVFLKIKFPQVSIDTGSSVSVFTSLFSELHELLKNDILTFELVSNEGMIDFYISCNKLNSISIINRLNLISGLRVEYQNTDQAEKFDPHIKILNAEITIVDRLVSPNSGWQKLKPFKTNDFETLPSMVNYLVNSKQSGSMIIAIRPAKKKYYIESMIRKFNNKTRKDEKINHNIANDVEMLEVKNQYKIYSANIYLVGNKEFTRNLSPCFNHIAGKNELVRIATNKRNIKLRYIQKEWTGLFVFTELFSKFLGYSSSPRGSYFNAKELAVIVHSFKVENQNIEIKSGQIIE